MNQRLHAVKAAILSSIVGLCLLALSLSAGSIEAATIHLASGSIVARPTLSAPHNTNLIGVATISPSNIWAIGGYFTNNGTDRTLTEHWNGTRWSIVKSPNASPGRNDLTSVAQVVGTGELWAVGDYANVKTSTYQTLVEHWNGTRWQIVQSPNVGTGDNGLSGVVALAANNVWAVGEYSPNPGGAPILTLTEHWNGTRWQIVPSPNVSSQSNALLAVTPVPGTNHLWAVGNACTNGICQTLVENWDGSHWSIVSSPNPGRSNNGLTSVVAVSATSAWAVGYYNNSKAYEEALIEHWNGARWSVVKSPHIKQYGNELEAVAAVSTNDIWVVGRSARGRPNHIKTLIEQWNGTSWSIVASPNVARFNYLYGVAAISARNIWAVGYDQIPGSLPNALIEHWDGTKWSVVPSP